MEDIGRRRALRLGGIAIFAGTAGCLEQGGGGDDGSDIQDSDGDGVIDSQDYAPHDPDIQDKPTPTPDSEEIDQTENQTEGETPAEPIKPAIETKFGSPISNLSGIEPHDDQLWLTFNFGQNNGEHYIVSKDGITQDTFSFQQGTYGVRGLAVHSDRIDFVGYEGTGNRKPRLFKVNKDRTLETRLQLQGNAPKDAASVDSYTWIAEYGGVKQLDSAGNVRQSISPRPDYNRGPIGLAHDGTNFWAGYNDQIIQFDSDGVIQSEYAYPRGTGDSLGCGYGYCTLGSLAHDGDSLWLGRSDKNNIVSLNTEY